MTQTINGTVFETKSVPVKGNRSSGRRVDHYVSVVSPFLTWRHAR